MEFAFRICSAIVFVLLCLDMFVQKLNCFVLISAKWRFISNSIMIYKQTNEQSRISTFRNVTSQPSGKRLFPLHKNTQHNILISQTENVNFGIQHINYSIIFVSTICMSTTNLMNFQKSTTSCNLSNSNWC